MDSIPGPLLPLLERERAVGRAMALGILAHTAGSTYRKPGAMLRMAAGGEYSGLISGGCLEGDLGERARAVIATGRAAAPAAAPHAGSIGRLQAPDGRWKLLPLPLSLPPRLLVLGAEIQAFPHSMLQARSEPDE